ncbi:MAG TPA: glycosyltransferase family A protein, partial [Actinophytocola sp.]|uniref:glycosyltransferase family A protein n=1 Tax=Actinophytocola sp. TaxID=1872138 RepID=UPI002E00A5B8|nr:glycosyltransferase family A protein [Actinophytocola sp.]
MSKRHDLAVVVPVFDTSPIYVDQCVASLYRAALFYRLASVSVILVDDGSTMHNVNRYDKTVEQWRKQGLDIALLSHEENRGMAAARDVGIRSAKADWVVLVDSDDMVSPWAFEA